MIRLMGADSGLTMAITRFAETMLPKPMLISLISIAVYAYEREVKFDTILAMFPLFSKLYDVIHGILFVDITTADIY